MNKLIPVMVALVLAGCSSAHQPTNDAHSPAPADARQLKGSEISQTLIGRQHSSVTTDGTRFSEILNPDGTANIEIKGQAAQSGKWTITEDVIRVTYPKYGKECNWVRTDGVSVWMVDATSNTTNNKFTLH